MLTELITRNIKRVRIHLNLTQAQVAAKAGVSAGHYNKIESLGSNLTIETIESIAEALGVPVGELFHGIATEPQTKEAIKKAIKLLQELV